jgi:hypothetical protein
MVHIYKIPILGDSFNLLKWKGETNLIHGEIDIENLIKNYKKNYKDSLHASPFEGYYYVTNKINDELKDFLYENPQNPQNPQNSVCTISFKDKKSKKKSKVKSKKSKKKSKVKSKKSKDKVKKSKKDK